MTRHDIYETKPASVYANRWRDGTPLGNGLTGAALFDGTVKLRWSMEDQAFSATFKARRDTSFRLELPFDQGVREVSLKAGETAVFKHNFR